MTWTGRSPTSPLLGCLLQLLLLRTRYPTTSEASRQALPRRYPPRLTNHGPCPPPGGGTIDAAQMAREKSRRLRRTERILYQIATPTCNRQAWTTVRAIGVQVMHQDHSHSAGSGLARINRPLALTTYCYPLARLGQ